MPRKLAEVRRQTEREIERERAGSSFEPRTSAAHPVKGSTGVEDACISCRFDSENERKKRDSRSGKSTIRGSTEKERERERVTKSFPGGGSKNKLNDRRYRFAFSIFSSLLFFFFFFSLHLFFSTPFVPFLTERDTTPWQLAVRTKFAARGTNV